MDMNSCHEGSMDLLTSSMYCDLRQQWIQFQNQFPQLSVPFDLNLFIQPCPLRLLQRIDVQQGEVGTWLKILVERGSQGWVESFISASRIIKYLLFNDLVVSQDEERRPLN